MSAENDEPLQLTSVPRNPSMFANRFVLDHAPNNQSLGAGTNMDDAVRARQGAAARASPLGQEVRFRPSISISVINGEKSVSKTEGSASPSWLAKFASLRNLGTDQSAKPSAIGLTGVDGTLFPRHQPPGVFYVRRRQCQRREGVRYPCAVPRARTIPLDCGPSTAATIVRVGALSPWLSSLASGCR